MSSSIFIPWQTLHFWCRKTTSQTWSQLVRLDLPLCSQPARPQGLWTFLFALHKQIKHTFKITECYLTPGGRLNSSKTKGALFIGEEIQGKWGRLCCWILEPTKEASPEKLDYRLLVLQWGDQRSPPAPPHPPPILTEVISNQRCSCPLTQPWFPYPAQASWVLVLFYEISLSWPWIKQSTDVWEWLQNSRGFWSLFLFLYFFKREPHCAHWNVEYFHRVLFACCFT